MNLHKVAMFLAAINKIYAFLFATSLGVLYADVGLSPLERQLVVTQDITAGAALLTALVAAVGLWKTFDFSKRATRKIDANTASIESTATDVGKVHALVDGAKSALEATNSALTETNTLLKKRALTAERVNEDRQVVDAAIVAHDAEIAKEKSP